MTAKAHKRSLNQSRKLFKEAKCVLVGGVNSPVRAFKAIGGTPIFFKRGKGAYLYDADNRRYIDYCASWGALALGHAHPTVVKKIQAQTTRGTSFGACTELETQLANELKKRYTRFSHWRFTSSGTEAVMTAIRLARGATGRSMIVKFEGCYHGHADALLVKAGSGLATSGTASSKGVPAGAAKDTLVLRFNDINQCKRAIEKHQPAAVIVEPVAGNMGLIPANLEFLQALRKLCTRTRSLLIFDEVMTGFRIDLKGAGHLYGVQPDLVTLGKVIGGGMPIGALGGGERVMRKLAPLGDVYQAGTLSGNSLSMTAGLETLKRLTPSAYAKSCKLTAKLARGLCDALRHRGHALNVPYRGTMFGLYFQSQQPMNFSDITQSHIRTYNRFCHHMHRHNVYLPPSGYEAMFMSTAHTERDIERTVDAAGRFQVVF